MGCLWSCESGDDNSRYSSTRASSRNTGRNTRNDRYGYGIFRCPCCNNQWESRKAWKDETQGCKKCTVYCNKHRTKNCSQCSVYPSGWRPLTAEEMRPCNDPEKDHKQALCGMCKRLGYYCGDRNKSRRVNKPSSGPRFPTRKSSKMPSRPPSYNSAMRRTKFTNKRFGKSAKW